MKSDNNLLLDIIYMKKKNNELYIQELSNSLSSMDEDNLILYKHDLKLKNEEIEFLNDIKATIHDSNDGLTCLKKMLKSLDTGNSLSLIKFNKIDVIKQILKEYRKEYRKNYWNNKRLGTKGIFDNKLFCEVIRKKIHKYTSCNKVTRKKYNHLAAFLTEFLHEMENSSDPSTTLKQKIMLYKKYKKTEYIEIRMEKFNKIDVINDILKEYNEMKIKAR